MQGPGSRNRRWMILAAGLVFAASCGGEGAPPSSGEGSPPSGGEDAGMQPREEETPRDVTAQELSDWSIRLDDEGADEAGFQMVASDTALHVTTGPAGVAWRPIDLATEGDFTASADFTELGAPAGHREAYGILVGGHHLESPDQEYTYFLVRGTGDYLIKRREGDDTRELVGWTASPAVGTGGGDIENRLAVEVRGDSVRFRVNDETVETLPASRVEPWGLAGLRVNHRLDVRIRDWTVTGARGQGM